MQHPFWRWLLGEILSNYRGDFPIAFKGTFIKNAGGSGNQDLGNTMNGNSVGTTKKGKKARILVVDDHPLVREGLAQMFRHQDDLECCGEAGTIGAVQKFLTTEKPDLVTVDLRLQNGDGLELLKIFKAQYPGLLSLVISQCDEVLYAERALKAGAKGYVMKERATEEVLTAIRTVLRGGIYVSPRIAALALDKMIGDQPGKNQHNLHHLSDRELQVLQLLGAGLSNRKVAAKLFLSVKTVESHRENIKHKLGIASAAELVRYATDWLNGQTSQHSAVSLPPAPESPANHSSKFANQPTA